jgi:hypothetical protein
VGFPEAKRKPYGHDKAGVCRYHSDPKAPRASGWDPSSNRSRCGTLRRPIPGSLRLSPTLPSRQPSVVHCRLMSFRNGDDDSPFKCVVAILLGIGALVYVAVQIHSGSVSIGSRYDAPVTPAKGWWALALESVLGIVLIVGGIVMLRSNYPNDP